MNHQDLFDGEIEDTRTMLDVLAGQTDAVATAIDACVSTLASGGKILLCGNGGSASDAQHIAAEFVGRLQDDRDPLPAIALTVNSSALTAIANDYGFEAVFARQVHALAQPGDVLIGISTSGSSANVLRAIEAARRIGCVTVGLTGISPSALEAAADLAIAVSGPNTRIIQHGHILVGHTLCLGVEQALAEG